MDPTASESTESMVSGTSAQEDAGVDHIVMAIRRGNVAGWPCGFCGSFLDSYHCQTCGCHWTDRNFRFTEKLPFLRLSEAYQYLLEDDGTYIGVRGDSRRLVWSGFDEDDRQALDIHHVEESGWLLGRKFYETYNEIGGSGTPRLDPSGGAMEGKTRKSEDQPSTDRAWLTLCQMAEYAGFSKSFISREIRLGKLKAVAKGEGQERHRWRARREWVDQWLEGSSAPPAAQTSS
jgi:hypothetical protein